ncbi:unnamed protein product, partial [Scytosiphon promiscuus]
FPRIVGIERHRIWCGLARRAWFAVSERGRGRLRSTRSEATPKRSSLSSNTGSSLQQHGGLISFGGFLHHRSLYCPYIQPTCGEHQRTSTTPPLPVKEHLIDRRTFAKGFKVRTNDRGVSRVSRRYLHALSLWYPRHVLPLRVQPVTTKPT